MWRKLLALLMVAALMILPVVAEDVLLANTAEDAQMTDEVENALQTVEPEAELNAEVRVSIVCAGEVEVGCELLTVTDVDGDGTLTVNDVLIVTHEAFYIGGAAEGYASQQSEYGMSVTMLWGEDHGGFGYCLNNMFCSSLLDPVADGDSVTAYTYADQTGWSDVYAYFTQSQSTVTAGQAFVLTAYTLEYDENWNVVRVPLKNAVITIDGQTTPYCTNADGQTFAFLVNGGDYLISARCAEKLLVTPTLYIHAEEPQQKVDVPEFTDVSSDAWYYDVVMEAASQNLLMGKDSANRIYGPDANLTVAEYLTILYRFGEKLGMYSGKTTTGSNWMEAAQFMMTELGITNLTLTDAITRGEMASATTSYIAELCAYTRRAVYTVNPVTFSDITGYRYAASVQFMQQAGLISGYTDGTFRPDKLIRRCEVAQIIYNFNHNLCLSEAIITQ